MRNTVVLALVRSVEQGSVDVTDETLIRHDIRHALDAWADGSGPYVGEFLQAVLSNDLKEAMGRADAQNLVTLPAIVSYVYRKLPMDCQGSPKVFAAWRKKHAERLQDARSDALMNKLQRERAGGA